MKYIKKLYKQWRDFLLEIKIKEIQRKYAAWFALSDGTWERLCHFQKLEQEEINSLKSCWK